MSTIVVRPWAEIDESVLSAIPVGKQPKMAAINHPRAYTYVALEDGQAVGLAVGRRSNGGPTCYLDYVRPFEEGRWDILLALMYRHAQNGIETGHTHALARVPMLANCTNLGTAVDVTDGLMEKVGLSWEDEGWNAKRKAAGAKRTEPVMLKDLLPRLENALKLLNCEVVRDDATPLSAAH